MRMLESTSAHSESLMTWAMSGTIASGSDSDSVSEGLESSVGGEFVGFNAACLDFLGVVGIVASSLSVLILILFVDFSCVAALDSSFSLLTRS